jgi:protein-S-isoprenylcysteine O-methyltransferase Ste14
MHLKIPPLLLTGAFAGLMVFAGQWPTLAIKIPAGGVISAVLAFTGCLFVGSGVRSFRKAKTTVNPRIPERSSALVVRGLYRYTRNPMYLGFLLLLIALGVYQELWMNLVLAPLGFISYMNKFQIIPEENALQEIYGAEYAAYQKKVRRWL